MAGSSSISAAQPVDVDVDRAGLARVVVAPDLLEELVAGEDLARVTDEEREQLEGLGLDRHGRPSRRRRWPAQVDLDPARGRRRRAARPTACCSPRRKIARIRADSSRRLNGLVT